MRAPKKALELIADELEDFPAQSIEIEIGGRDHSGKYVLAAVMNASSRSPPAP